MKVEHFHTLFSEREGGVGGWRESETEREGEGEKERGREGERERERVSSQDTVCY